MECRTLVSRALDSGIVSERMNSRTWDAGRNGSRILIHAGSLL